MKTFDPNSQKFAKNCLTAPSHSQNVNLSLCALTSTLADLLQLRCVLFVQYLFIYLFCINPCALPSWIQEIWGVALRLQVCFLIISINTCLTTTCLKALVFLSQDTELKNDQKNIESPVCRWMITLLRCSKHVRFCRCAESTVFIERSNSLFFFFFFFIYFN